MTVFVLANRKPHRKVKKRKKGRHMRASNNALRRRTQTSIMQITSDESASSVCNTLFATYRVDGCVYDLQVFDGKMTAKLMTVTFKSKLLYTSRKERETLCNKKMFFKV